MNQKTHQKSIIGIIMLLFSVTASFAQFTITSPTASTIWRKGEICTITWTTDSGAPSIINIRLIYNDGGFVLDQGLQANVQSAPGTFSFTLSQSLSTGKYYTVCFQHDFEDCSETFTILNSTVGIEEKNDYSEIQIYPNPITDLSMLHFTLQKRAPLKVLLYDLLGNEVACLKNEISEPGNIEIPLPGPTQSGIYFLRIQIAESNFTRKLLIN